MKINRVIFLGFFLFFLLCSLCFAEGEEAASPTIKTGEAGTGIVPLLLIDYSREDLLKKLPFEILMETQILATFEKHGRVCLYSSAPSIKTIFMNTLKRSESDPQKKEQLSFEDFLILRVQGIANDKNVNDMHWYFLFVRKSFLTDKNISFDKESK